MSTGSPDHPGRPAVEPPPSPAGHHAGGTGSDEIRVVKVFWLPYIRTVVPAAGVAGFAGVLGVVLCRLVWHAHALGAGSAAAAAALFGWWWGSTILLSPIAACAVALLAASILNIRRPGTPGWPVRFHAPLRRTMRVRGLVRVEPRAMLVAGAVIGALYFIVAAVVNVIR
ncbi:MAG TPA: hypothetical protein QGH10_05625, partial [Armatimonadota bacterium]|nr:hypothetical protein [Armatimonadota bacterium]